jgi:beta-glucosidase/6-phospho-beta-glucosidase/beta-galactosidase
VILTYLGEMLKGVNEGIPIKGVFAWALTDNWEWNAGFSGGSHPGRADVARFGGQHVDYSHPTLKRTVSRALTVLMQFKRSAIEMSKFWKAHRAK